MRKTEVAKAINRGAPTGILTAVLASSELSVPKSKLTSFACLHCNTQFASITNTKPFCITCGTEEVIDLHTEKEPELLEEETDLTGVHCASCGTHNIMSDRVAAALGGHAFCITCGENLEYSIPEGIEDKAGQPDDLVFSDAEEYEDEANELGNGEDQRLDAARPAAKDGYQATQQQRRSSLTNKDREHYPTELEEDDDEMIELYPSEADLIDELDEDLPDETLERINRNKSEAATKKQKSKLPKHSTKLTQPKSPEDEHQKKANKRNKSESDLDVTLEDKEGDEVKIETENGDGKKTIDIVEKEGDTPKSDIPTDSNDKDNVPVDLDEVTPEKGEFNVFQSASNLIVATVNGIPVATLNKDKVNSDLWGKSNWLQAIKQVAAKEGRKQALSQFQFESIVVRFPLKQRIQQAALMQTEKHNRIVTAKIRDLREDYKQSIAIAAAGLNKGFFKKENPLKAGFYDELYSVGVTKPTILIDKVFASVGQQFLATLLELAEEMLDKPLELRNQIAETVESANYMHAVPEEDADDEETLDVRARLNNTVIRPNTETSSINKRDSLFN